MTNSYKCLHFLHIHTYRYPYCSRLLVLFVVVIKYIYINFALASQRLCVYRRHFARAFNCRENFIIILIDFKVCNHISIYLLLLFFYMYQHALYFSLYIFVCHCILSLPSNGFFLYIYIRVHYSKNPYNPFYKCNYFPVYETKTTSFFKMFK